MIHIAVYTRFTDFLFSNIAYNKNKNIYFALDN